MLEEQIGRANDTHKYAGRAEAGGTSTSTGSIYGQWDPLVAAAHRHNN